VTAFDINEDIKEKCILLGALSCYTEFRTSCNPNHEESHWYNKITLPLNLNKNHLTLICEMIEDYLEKMEYLGVENILTDVNINFSERHIRYWVFCSRKEFIEKELLLDK
jgi:hypothetical protein